MIARAGISKANCQDIAGALEQLLTRLYLFEPVSENPVLTLDLPTVTAVSLQGRDNNGNPVSARVLGSPSQ